MGTKLELARCTIDKLVAFISAHLKLSQGHMVDYFIQNLYKNCIPTSIQVEIEKAGLENAVDYLLLKENHSKDLKCIETFENLSHFVREARGYSLYNLKDICLKKKEFFELHNFEDEQGLKLDVFMKEKKSHEVETLSIVAKNVARRARTSHLVDIGDGKGYLSSLIAFHHQLPVLGVDGSLVNTESSVKRAGRLEKRWEHVVSRFSRKNAQNGNLDASTVTGTGRELNQRILLYKQVTQLVTEKTDFDELIRAVFLEDPAGIGLVGLHTCGNLGPTSVRIFNAVPNIKSIVNVSCCYHLLNENYLANSAMGSIGDDQDGFPMSAHLKSKDFTLPRATRMLSAHSLDRIIRNRELPSKIVFYRALLEVVFEGMGLKGRNVGKFRKEPENFAEYARTAATRLGVVLKHSDRELEELYAAYETRRKELNAFYLVRSMLAPAIEALILLDRFLFLVEEGYEDVHLVQLFDPVISPRCYGLVCIK